MLKIKIIRTFYIDRSLYIMKGGYTVSLDLSEQYDKIYRYCYFKTYNSQLAEDLTQEAFLKYFSHTLYINHGKSLAYLYTIAKNLCVDYYRRNKEILLEDEVEVATPYHNIETSIAVQQAIKTLPIEIQEIILLRFSNELSIGEISEITSLSRFTIYRRIKEGLKQLKSVLREEDFCE